MPYIKKDSYNLYYEYEYKSQNTLVFIHGLGANINQIKNTYYNTGNNSLLLIDMEGHGKSEVDLNNYNFSSFSDDIKYILDYLNIKKIALAGISMGSATAINFTLKYPEYVNKLILIRNAWTNKSMHPEFVELYDIVAEALKAKNIQILASSEQFIKLKSKSNQATTSLVNYFNDSASLKCYQKFNILPKSQPFSELKDLNKIKIDTLIVSNHNDPIHPYEYGEIISENINNSKFIEITSKDIDKNKHIAELNLNINKFLIDGN